jgi:protein-serine/threonine kinase
VTGSSAKDVVLARSSVPYSDVFPIRDQHVGPQHFRMLKLLGRGGIGRVFLVQLKGTSKLYAMKVLTKEEMIQRNKVKRVMTEREILATANHPFVVTMYASFQTSDRLSFVMDYCSGGEFFKVLQRQPKRRLKEEAVKFYAAEVTLALEYLHHMGFIYRDLKPENILLRSNGHIALTDFDLSKQAHAVSPRVIQQQLSMSDKIKRSFSLKRNNSSLNNLEIVDSEPILPYQTNSFVGTEDYISPEIVNGVGQSSAVDWWTLGILIYEMLTGTTPFRAGTSDETFNNIVTNQVKWPDDVHVSPECKQIVKKLLRREPEKRLGAENGATDIKRHKWFAGFNFALVRNATPPIIPKIRNPLDFTQYPGVMAESDETGTDDTASAGAPEAPDTGDNENPANPFVNFNIRRDSHVLRY